MENTERVTDVHRRRQPLQDAAHRLDEALCRPIDQEDWLTRVSDALDVVEHRLDDHIDSVVGDGGMYDEIRDIAPQLDNRLRSLQADHATIKGLIDQTRADIELGLDRDAVRSSAMMLLSRLARHCQKTADLIYEAYTIDIGVGD